MRIDTRTHAIPLEIPANGSPTKHTSLSSSSFKYDLSPFSLLGCLSSVSLPTTPTPPSPLLPAYQPAQKAPHMGRDWQPPCGPVSLASGGGADAADNDSPDARRVAELRAALGGLGNAPPPPPSAMPPVPASCPPPEPGAVEKLVGLCTSEEWGERWRGWVEEAGVTRDLVACMREDGGEKPQEVMVVYRRFLDAFDDALTKHCREHGLTEQQLYALCSEEMQRGGLVASYLSLVLDQSDYTSFVTLLSQYVP